MVLPRRLPSRARRGALARPPDPGRARNTTRPGNNWTAGAQGGSKPQLGHRRAGARKLTLRLARHTAEVVDLDSWLAGLAGTPLGNRDDTRVQQLQALEEPG